MIFLDSLIWVLSFTKLCQMYYCKQELIDFFFFLTYQEASSQVWSLEKKK